ncbi:MAG: GreA/GreB family elongation factor [Patescibacteria group bacterium]|jgi:transcription elongation factor GreA
MQTPIRKAETYRRPKPDPYITPEKFRELTLKLEKLKTVSRPRESQEVKRLALMGDFSENAGYQLAKGRLRGINQRILDIEEQLKFAEIINGDGNNDTVRLGHLVTVETAKKQKTYRLLGSAETNPDIGVISHNSPLGAALINRRVGDIIKVQLADRQIEYKIIKID